MNPPRAALGRRPSWAPIRALLSALLLVSFSPLPSQAADEIPGSVLDHVFTVPKRGQHMSQVRNQIGPPSRVLPWVGDPPITRWIYPRFTVYFQEWRVAGVVRNRPGEGATYRISERNE